MNFGDIDTVPARFKNRKLLAPNAQVTLMRTTPEENCLIARWTADKLIQSTSSVTVLVPECGLSSLDAPVQPFHDPEADSALFDELGAKLEQTERQ